MVDPSGQFWGSAILGTILKAAVTALVVTACIVVIAQPIIQKSTSTGTLGGITGNSIIGNQRSKIETKPSDRTKSKDIAPAIPKTKETQGQTYYHVTTPENAASIKATGLMKGSAWEGNFVYAWKLKPDKMAIENSGAHLGVVFSFKTNATFTMDPGIDNPKVLKYGPVVSTSPGPIVVWDVQIVEVME